MTICSVYQAPRTVFLCISTANVSNIQVIPVLSLFQKFLYGYLSGRLCAQKGISTYQYCKCVQYPGCSCTVPVLEVSKWLLVRSIRRLERSLYGFLLMVFSWFCLRNKVSLPYHALIQQWTPLLIIFSKHFFYSASKYNLFKKKSKFVLIINAMFFSYI